jgi:4-amino-4-deoxychorismate lyase/para-aminobenzoate synthetase/4-amino-4-deoxychorismate lyase
MIAERTKHLDAKFQDTNMCQFELLETMAFEPGCGIRNLHYHLDRLFHSAQRFQFSFDQAGVTSRLAGMTSGIATISRVRLTLGAGGAVNITVTPFEADYGRALIASFAPRNAPRDDIRLYHKTTERSLYEWPTSVREVDEIIFVDHEGYITEGSFNTVFVVRDNMLLTPPINRGVLPGVLRRILLEKGLAVECDIKPMDCQKMVFLGNSARGLRHCTVLIREE